MLRATINELMFVVRSVIAPRGRDFREPELELEVLPSFARAMLASERANILIARYRLEPVRNSALILGTLFLIDLFDKLFAEKPEYFSELQHKSGQKLLDVGAKDFESVRALHHAFNARVTGVEVDPRWRDAGLARAAHTPGDHRYLVEDIFLHRYRYSVITWLHPFLDEERLLEWGLPIRFLKPRAMLSHVLSLLEPGGVLVIVNQDLGECERQRALLSELTVAHESLEIPLHFRARDEPAYVHLVRAI